MKWKFETENAISFDIVLTPDGTILFVNQNNVLYAVHPDGSLRWKQADIQYHEFPPTVTRHGDIFVPTTNGFLMCIAVDGLVKWRHSFGNRTVSPPVVSPGGMAYFILNDRVNNQNRGYLCAARIYDPGPTRVEDAAGDRDGNAVRPDTITLGVNYPNPFNPVTTIPFTLTAPEHVVLTIYTVTGKKLATLADGVFTAGTHGLSWNASGMASGIYMYRLDAGGSVRTGRMVLMK